MKRNVILLTLVFALFAVQVLAQIEIDGDMLDWEGIQPADVGMAAEELGDMATGPMFDIQDFYITSNDSMIFLRITIDPSATFSDGFTDPHIASKIELWFDVTLDDTTGLGWGWWPMALDYMMELDYAINPAIAATEATILYYHGDYATSVWPDDFDSVGVAFCAVNDDDNQIEVGFPRAAINAGTEIRPMIYSVGDWIWASEDIVPNDQSSGNVPAYVINYSFVYGPSVVQIGGDEINSAIEIDGDMLDWEGIVPADQGKAAEELGDMTTGPMFDIQDLFMTSDSENIYYRITIDPSATFSDGFTDPHVASKIELWFDTNWGDTTGLGWGWWPIAVDYMLELDYAINPAIAATEATILYFHGDYTTSVWPDDFDSVGVAYCAVNDDDNEIEVAIPRAALNVGTDFRPMIYAVGDWIWASEDLVPNDQSSGNFPTFVINYNFVNGPSVVQMNGALETGIANRDKTSKPTNFQLSQNFPNPFNPKASIRFTLLVQDHVTLKVYNSLGQLMQTLVDANQAAANYVVSWDGRDYSGNQAASGVYFYKLETARFSQTKKMILMR